MPKTLGNKLGNFTPEERAANLEKARKAREQKKEAGQHLRNDFVDEPHWRANASKLGFRLAASYIPASEGKYLRRLLKHLDRDMDWWRECTGYKNVEQFYKDNPDWPCYALQGITIDDYLEEVNAI